MKRRQQEMNWLARSYRRNLQNTSFSDFRSMSELPAFLFVAPSLWKIPWLQLLLSLHIFTTDLFVERLRVCERFAHATLGLFPFQLSAPNIHEFKVTVTPTLHAFCFILLFLGTNSVFASIIPISFAGPTAALDLAVAQHILTRKGSYTHWAAGFNKTEVCFHANAWTLLQFHYKAD